MAMMAIVFAYQLSFVAFAAFFRLELGWERVKQWRLWRRVAQAV
jgi:hypothetical protein